MTQDIIERALVALRTSRALLIALDSADYASDIDMVTDAINALTPTVGPDDKGMLWWLIRVGVHSTLVTDGADFTDSRALTLLQRRFPYAMGHELEAHVVARPADAVVSRLQGFASAAEYRRDRDQNERR